MFTIGVIACLHGDLKKARTLAQRFVKEKVDAIVLNGDTPSDKDQYKNLVSILNIFTKTKKKVFIQPGSHEHYDHYTTAHHQ